MPDHLLLGLGIENLFQFQIGIVFFWGGGVGYCMIVEIKQIALSYYLKKHHGLNDHESALLVRGAICRAVKSIQMFQSAKREWIQH